MTRSKLIECLNWEKVDIERMRPLWQPISMLSSPAIDAARHFIRAACDGPVSTDAQLSEALDRLVAAYHVTPDAVPSHVDRVAPRNGGPAHFQRVSARFVDYGCYPVADPMDPPGAPPLIGDAVDDLSDIILDMRAVVWLADNVGIDDAHVSFRVHFFHWGTHARDLLRYLHARQFG